MKKIKSIISLTIIILVLAPSVNAQQKPFKFGFKIAPAISWLSPDAQDYEAGGSAFTFGWGFISDFTLMDNYYVSTGFNMSYFQGKLNFPHQYVDDNEIAYEGQLNRVYNLRYLEVPVALKMKTNELTNNVLFFGMIGFNTGFKLRAKANDSFKGYDSDNNSKTYTDDKLDIRDEIKLAKVSLLVGAGVEYVVDESVSILMGLNFNNGFSNVLKGNNTLDNSIEARAIPYYFELNLGVIF